MISCSKTPNIMGFLIFNLCWDRIYFLETKNQRTNGPVNAKYMECEKDFQLLRLWVTGFF